MESYTKEERRTNGVFYTPPFLAHYLAGKVIKYSKKRDRISAVLDPACGDGILLRSLAGQWVGQFDGISPLIVGVDKDEKAITSSQSFFSREPLSGIKSRFIHDDGLFPCEMRLPQVGWSKMHRTLGLRKGFDIAISNPPWGADLNGYNRDQLSKSFSLAKGQFDIFDLFTEVILSNLAAGGVYGLILPDSVFNREQKHFRCLLSHSTTIHLIARLGEKIFPEINRACVIIVGENSPAREEHAVDCFRLTSRFKKEILSDRLSLEHVEKELVHKVYQRRFYENDDCVFDIDLKEEEERTFTKIHTSGLWVKNVAIGSRGAEISKRGIICRCPKCRLWMPFPRSNRPKCSKCGNPLDLSSVRIDTIILNHNGRGNVKLKVGEDLFRFTSTSNRWINTLKHGINYKDIERYKGPKILVRKTGVGITASIDYDDSVTNQVVYMLKLSPDYAHTLTLEFVLAILNSRAMTFYLIKRYGENEWKSHPYLTQTSLGELPFPKMDPASKAARKMIQNVTKLVKTEVLTGKDKNISKQSDVLIERVVAHLYGLNRRDYQRIFATLRSSEQLLPIRRLLNCTIDEIFGSDGL